MVKYTISSEMFLEMKRLKSFYPKMRGKRLFKKIVKGDVWSEIDFADRLENMSDFIEIFDKFEQIGTLYDVDVIAPVPVQEQSYLWLPAMYAQKRNNDRYPGQFNSIKIMSDGTFFVGVGYPDYHRNMGHFYTKNEMIEAGFNPYEMQYSTNGHNWEIFNK